MGLLPIHGFVLAGGQSSRMGRDKALLSFAGRPLVEIAVGTLRSFCAEVSLAGNREDLNRFAPVVRESRVGAGPAAGIEAGLQISKQPWALFVPVDVPLLPAPLLRAWAEAVLARAASGTRLSFVRAGGQAHPAISLLHQDCFDPFVAAVGQGTCRLRSLFDSVCTHLGPDSVWIAEAEDLASASDTGVSQSDLASAINLWFSNINTSEDLSRAEQEFAAREQTKQILFEDDLEHAPGNGGQLG